MGHVQPGGAAATPLTADPLWPTWRALVREFRFSRLLRQLATSRSGYGFYGVDVISTLRETPMAEGGLAILTTASDGLLDRLAALAAVNARRNEALWRMAALFYVTVPATLFLAGLEGAPDIVALVLAEAVVPLILTVVSLTAWLLYYFASQWRARQIEAVIELARIERMGGPA